MHKKNRGLITKNYEENTYKNQTFQIRNKTQFPITNKVLFNKTRCHILNNNS